MDVKTSTTETVNSTPQENAATVHATVTVEVTRTGFEEPIATPEKTVYKKTCYEHVENDESLPKN